MAGTGRFNADRAEYNAEFLAARAGDPTARWRALDACRAYLRLVVGKNRWSGGAEQPATSDLVQETILEGWRGFGRFRGKTQEQLRAWLRVTLVHNLIKKQRRPRLARLDFGADDSKLSAAITPVCVAVERADANESVQRALRSLPEHYQAVIDWRIWKDLSFAEIGSRLGISDDSAQKLYARAIARLRRITGSCHGSE
jgi:RNA polymerase sigma factor (sigma-70 family)